MPAALWVKAALSAAAVGVLLALLRRAGPRAGGLAAAVPISSVPALYWLSVERGAAYAADVALGSLFGTALTALLGMTLLDRAAPRQPHRRHHDSGGALLSIGVAGAMSLLLSELSRHSAPQLCGLIAALPVVGVTALVAAHRQGGAPLMFAVLAGYLEGMPAKAAFLGLLGLAWGVGTGAWAWAIAPLGAGLTLLAQRSLRQARQCRPESGRCAAGLHHCQPRRRT